MCLCPYRAQRFYLPSFVNHSNVEGGTPSSFTMPSPVGRNNAARTVLILSPLGRLSLRMSARYVLAIVTRSAASFSKCMLLRKIRTSKRMNQKQSSASIRNDPRCQVADADVAVVSIIDAAWTDEAAADCCDGGKVASTEGFAVARA